MMIRVKVGNVELEYSQPTNVDRYPACINDSKLKNMSEVKTVHGLLLKTVDAMVDKAATVHAAIKADSLIG